MRLCHILVKGQAPRLRRIGRRARHRLVLALFIGFGGFLPAQAQQAVDMELVLAVDASGSVDEAEFRLQMGGIAHAFRDPAVVEAIARGPEGRIAVNLAVWAQSEMPKDSIGWHLVEDAGGAAALAATIERHPRRVIGGTGIGRALLYAVGLFANNGFTSPRRVIDISGDGRETTFRTWSVPPEQARFKARAEGVTINGLAILTDEPDLADYYRRNVTSGPESFVMEARNFQSFSEAMREKLLREIQYRPKIGALTDSAEARVVTTGAQKPPSRLRRP